MLENTSNWLQQQRAARGTVVQRLGWSAAAVLQHQILLQLQFQLLQPLGVPPSACTTLCVFVCIYVCVWVHDEIELTPHMCISNWTSRHVCRSASLTCASQCRWLAIQKNIRPPLTPFGQRSAAFVRLPVWLLLPLLRPDSKHMQLHASACIIAHAHTPLYAHRQLN